MGYNMNVEEVKPGDILYVWSSLYIGHGEDDVAGGKAIVKRVVKNKDLPADHSNTYMVEFHNLPGRSYNLRALLKDQEELQKRYGDAIAHADPDYGSYHDEY
jgi:hypothetical protein